MLRSRPLSEAETLGDLLAVLADLYEERPAVREARGELSFRSLHRAADRWAGALAGADVAGGQVGLLAANRAEWLAAAFGTWRARATLVPLSTFATAHELAEILAEVDLDVLLVQPRVASRDFLRMLEQIPAAVRPPRIVFLADSAPAPFQTAQFFLRGTNFVRRGPIDPESVACILYTSGTSGRPKGVMLSHRGILATVPETARRSGLGPEDSMLSTPPLFWVAGLAIRALPTLAAGCCLHLLETFRPGPAIDVLERHRPTALHLRPPQAALLLDHPRFRPALLENVHRGTGRVEWYAPHLDPRRARFTTGYGMTEMSGYVMSSDWRDEVPPGGEPRARLMPGVEARIVDARGCDRPTGEVGEIRLRGPGMFSGYRNQPAGAGLDEHGFFVSGDLGRLKPDGALEFIGRNKDLLRVKGINVSPLEVESVLAAHPGVETVYVVGLPVRGSDQRLVALVVTRDGRSLPRDGLVRLALQRLSPYKRPEAYFHLRRDQVPLGPTQKPLRDALGSLAASLIDDSEGGAPSRR